MIIALSGTESALGGLVGLIFALFGLVVVVVWLIFPFLVVGGLNSIEKVLKKQNELLEKIADRSGK